MTGISRVLLLSCVLPLSACSLVGQSESSCPGKPNGYICKGPREVYELTNTKDSLFDGTQDGADGDEKKPGAGDADAAAGAVVDMPNRGGTFPAKPWGDPMAAPEPLAVRSDARMLRILFNAYEDNKGSLNMPGYAYVEVEPRRWIVGAAANNQPAKIVPLATRQEADANLTGKEVRSMKVDPLGVKHTITQPGTPIPPAALRK